MLKRINPSITKGELWGVYGVKMQKSGKSTKRLDRLAPNLVHVCGFISEWTFSPSIHQGAFGGGVLGVKNKKVWKIYQTVGPIDTKFGTRLQIHMGMDIGWKQTVPRDPGVIFGFGWSKCNQKFEECRDLQRKNENKLYKNEMHK